MLICYVNEAGCSGEIPSAQSPVMPLQAIAGVAIDAAGVGRLTAGLAGWKLRFFPGLCRELASPLESILIPVRGAELRRLVRRSPRQRRFALRALGALLDLLEAEDARILGRVWIKGIDEPHNRRATFFTSLQTIFGGLGDLALERDTQGAVVFASGHQPPGEALSQQLFSRRFGGEGPLTRLVDLPTFGHPTNHAGLQVAELLCSALLFPLGVHSYCRGYIKNGTHLSETYAELKASCGARLEKLQHRYQDGAGKWQGGITVSDLLGGRPGGLLFR